MRTQRLLAAIPTLWLLACQPPPAAPSDPAQDPLEDAPTIDGTPTCVALEAGEVLLDVSPEGHAWLAAGGQVRVLAPEDLEVLHQREVALSELGSLRAWTASEATVSAQGELWRLEDFARVRREAPQGDLSSVSLCGALDTDGVLLSEGWLFELQDDTWRAWDTGRAGAQAPSQWLDRLGACRGPDEAMWATSEDGTLWRIQDELLTEHARFDALRAAGATAHHVFALDGDLLWRIDTGAPESWESWDLGEGAVAIVASTTAVWVQIPGALLRWDQGQWSQLTLPDAQTPIALHAHDNGIWWATQDTICHHTAGAGVFVEGLRPFDTTRATSLPLTLRAAEPITVTLGERTLETTQLEDAWSIELPLDQVGWHDLRLTTSQGTRHVPIERLPPIERSWAEEVQPIFEIHCAECHSQDTLSVDLSTHASWVDRADKIRAFVVDAQSMPPEASRKDAWGEDALRVITEWLDGEQQP